MCERLTTKRFAEIQESDDSWMDLSKNVRRHAVGAEKDRNNLLIHCHALEAEIKELMKLADLGDVVMGNGWRCEDWERLDEWQEQYTELVLKRRGR